MDVQAYIQVKIIVIIAPMLPMNISSLWVPICFVGVNCIIKAARYTKHVINIKNNINVNNIFMD